MKKKSFIKLVTALAIILASGQVFGQFVDGWEILNADVKTPQDVKSVDLDNDGDMDIVVSSKSDRHITWYENDGAGNYYGQKIVTPDFLNPNSMGIGDFDNNGTLDVMAFGYGALGDDPDGQIAWFSNDGTGNFGEAILVNNAYTLVEDIFISDLNGDGHLDVVFTTYSENTIAWCANDGDGNFGAAEVISADISSARAVHAADLDGDGDNDVVTKSGLFSGNTVWFENDGTGGFGSEIVISPFESGVRDIHAEDIDDDGDLDLLFASFYSNHISWYANDGDGNFGPQIIITNLTNGPERTAAGDLDGDGDLDVVSASFNDNKIAWYENIGGGDFEYQILLTIDAIEASNISLSDLDGDDDLDILYGSGSNRVAWFENDGSGEFIAETTITTSIENPSSITLSDLDNDGDLDMLLTGQSEDGVFLFWNEGDAQFSPQSNIPHSYEDPVNIDTGDLDGDGDEDVLVAFFSGYKRIGWFENMGDGSFGELETIFFTTASYARVVAADLDDDGDLDALCGGSDGIRWYENDGIGNFVLAEEFDFDIYSMVDLLAVDLDNDSDLDILYGSGGDVFWYRNLGDGSFVSEGDLVPFVPITPRDLDVADLNGDDLIDVIVSDGGGGDDDVVWYENEGMGVFAYPIAISLPGDHDNINSVVAVDIEGDGDMDVIAASSFDHKIAWYFNDGAGNFGEQNAIELDINPFSAPKGFIVSDIDEDTDADIIVYDWALDKVALTRNSFDCFSLLAGINYPDQICYDDSLIAYLDISPSGVMYEWFFDGVVSDDDVFTYLPDASGSMDLTLSISTELCSQDTTVTVMIHPEVPVTNLTESEICMGDSVLIFDQYQFATGIYFDTLSTIFGCDSILTQELTVYDLPEVTFEALTDELLCIGESLSLTGTPSEGAFSGPGVIGDEFYSGTAGVGLHTLFYTFVDDNGCTAIDSVQVSVVDCLGLPEPYQNNVTIYPNPFDNFTTVSFEQPLQENHFLIIYDVLGNEVYRNENVTGTSLKIEKQDLEAGVYILSMFNSNSEAVFSTKLLIK